MSTKPNILFILAEDICPNLGCYGDPDAITPNLDALAAEGMLYENATSVAPVCSAARTTLALGVYPQTAGVGNHRSCVVLPPQIKVISKYMSENGYYTAINKTDYNFYHDSDSNYVEGWDAIFDAPYFGDDARIAATIREKWANRGDKPFFFMHTFACTHQSKYGFPNNPTQHRKDFIPRTPPEHYRDRERLSIPPYHPDNADTREIWGQYHETISAMDRMVGETINHLKSDGLYDDTIVIFVGDNGMGIPGGKANMWNEGIHVPMIVRIPPKFQMLAPNYICGGNYVDEISFIDIPRTLIRLGGGDVPHHMHGRDFLSDSPQKYSYCYRNRIDGVPEFVRIVRSNDFIYIRNFFPHRGWRFSPYMVKEAPYFINSWEKSVAKQEDRHIYNRKNAFFLHDKPCEELYDLNNDKAQLNNLAYDSEYINLLHTMRTECTSFMLTVNDMGFMPEQLLNEIANTHSCTHYDVAQNSKYYPINELIDLADLVFSKDVPISHVKSALLSNNLMLRYWAIQLVLFFELSELLPLLDDLLLCDSVTIKIAAAEAIITLSCEPMITAHAIAIIGDVFSIDNDALAVLEATHCLYRLEEKAIELIPKTKRFCNVDKISTEKHSERVTIAVEDMATFNAEMASIPFEYDLTQESKQRLTIFRNLCNT